MDNLIIIKRYDDGAVLVGDSYGETQFMTKQEYENYLENIKKLSDNVE